MPQSSVHGGWPQSGEIDIMEHVKQESVEKTAEKLTFYVNGEETFSYPNLHLANEAEMKQWPFTEDNPFYIILNMGLGGARDGSWAGPIDDANLPAIMDVDWIRVSKLDE